MTEKNGEPGLLYFCNGLTLKGDSDDPYLDFDFETKTFILGGKLISEEEALKYAKPSPFVHRITAYGRHASNEELKRLTA